jgi:hypothetical protein
MPVVWQRHPRYFLLVALVLTTTFFLLSPYESPLSTDSYAAYIRDNTLPARLERSERVYQKVIAGRKDLIQRYGPNSRDIVMCVPPAHYSCCGELNIFQVPTRQGSMASIHCL